MIKATWYSVEIGGVDLAVMPPVGHLLHLEALVKRTRCNPDEIVETRDPHRDAVTYHVVYNSRRWTGRYD